MATQAQAKYKIVEEQSLAPAKIRFNVYRWDDHDGYTFVNGFDSLDDAEQHIKPRTVPPKPTTYYDEYGNKLP